MKGLGMPVMIRLGSEMNGDWMPFGVSTANYIGAYRRVVDLCQPLLEADFIFQPNPQPKGKYPQWFANRKPWKDYYPGDAYVDWIGVSWHSFGVPRAYGMNVDQAFADGEYLSFAEQHDKPLGSFEMGTDKYWTTSQVVPVVDQARFVKNTFDFISAHDRWKAFTWYDLNWTLNFPETLTAYKGGIASDRYIDHVEPTPPPHKIVKVDLRVTGTIEILL